MTSSGHEVDVTIEICGIPTDVTAVFNINSFSTPASWDEPGEGAEVEVTAVYYADDKEGKRDISDMLSGLRDLEFRYHTTYPNRTVELLPTGAKVTLGEPVRKLCYGYGFQIGHRREYGPYDSTLAPWEQPSLVVPSVIFNSGRTLYDVVEMEVINHVNENENDYIPVFDDDV